MAGIVPDDEPEVAPSLPIAKVENPDLPPLPPLQPATAAFAKDSSDPLAEQLKLARLKMLQKAIMAKTEIAEAASRPAAATGAAAAGSAAHGRSAPAVAPGSGDAALSNGAGAPNTIDGAPAGGKPGEVSPNNSYAQYSTGAGNSRWKLGEQVEGLSTLFTLRAGFVIPATLISGVNSDLPGQIIAQVSQDVYDTPTGKYKLIPQGTRLVGTYNSSVAYGQSRVLIAWQRLVFPDGKALDIGSMPGADSAGYAGFKDKVNNHYLRIFGSAFLMSGIVAGINSTQTVTPDDPFGNSINSLASQAIAQEMGRVAVEMIKKNMNISPTLEIRPGYRFNVMVTKDLEFKKPYQPFDY